MPMQYPGHIVKVGETDAAVVKALKARLNTELGIGNDPALRLDETDANFGAKMRQVVKLFQARNVDPEGRPLKQDGEVGAITWAVLFGQQAVQNLSQAIDPLLAEVIKVAQGEEAKKVREQPRNSNGGPEVDAYLASVGLGSGFSWCCSFTYWCFEQAARQLKRSNPMVRTGGCLKHWNEAPSKGAKLIAAAAALADPGLLRPGMLFIMDHGKGLGHTGLIESVAGGLLTTIEGNTDGSGTREGGGVYRLVRKVSEINKGYIDYSGVR
ncbi:CHAP domain-containing protein [Roseateles oligotrophus]|uniref:CHAP domain-containing protein n=1 Tax=Roseateles oligotrophus TaxID=1769250 RepID=A0ABT2YM42_9BURK|nr:CHAP domain-containing protein [Roseateles oligotrophus]MCV2371137.1 CHAP domain-containing protein [Roseateles oligotrophus]